MLLKNDRIVITGASRGIGKAIALECAKEGATVILLYKKEEKEAKKVARACGNALLYKCDVGNSESVKRTFADIRRKIKRLDGLVNNAGVKSDRSLYNMSEEEWRSVMRTNVDGLFFVTKPALRLLKRGSSIVNIASVVAFTGNIGQTNYAASKAAVVGFTKSLSKELGPRGIRVNAVAPGRTETDMLDGAVLKKMAAFALTSLRRSGKPKEIARAVVFLLSKDASYITGAIVRADGGLNF